MLRIFICCCNDVGDENRECFVLGICDGDFIMYGPYEGGE